MKVFQPAVDPMPETRGHFLHKPHKFLRGQAMQQAGIHMPERLRLADQSRPGAHRLPAAHALLHPIGVFGRTRAGADGTADKAASGI
jgi:hypothetical protein